MAVMGVWAFILCTRHRWHIKQKKQKPWKHTKQIFPEQKTEKSFVLPHLCPVLEVLTGIWNHSYLDKLSIHLVRESLTVSLGIYKTMPLATMSQQAHACWEMKYWSPSTLLVCGHFIQIHACMSICFSCMYTNNYKHFHKWFGIFYSDNSVLMRVPHIQ